MFLHMSVILSTPGGPACFFGGRGMRALLGGHACFLGGMCAFFEGVCFFGGACVLFSGVHACFLGGACMLFF